MPFEAPQDINYILLCATGRDDLFTLRETQRRQRSSSEIIHYLGWPVCSTSFSSGNKVDGLPLVANTVPPESNTGEESIGPEPHP